jgi:hypothetical protein
MPGHGHVGGGRTWHRRPRSWEIAERFFFGLNAKVEMVPVMALEDLQRGLSNIDGIVQRKRWG